MIIGVNGKIGSGKDTVGKIIQYLTLPGERGEYIGFETYDDATLERNSPFKVKKFAGKLKQTASLLTGIPVEMFEDQEFKKTLLGPEWGNVRTNSLNAIPVFGDVQFNELMSVRELLQKLGTEAMRDGLHENTWVNALFADYRTEESWMNVQLSEKPELVYPNWIITDMRFPNEMEAVVERRGVTIRVVRPEIKEYFQLKKRNGSITHATLHPSETALDNAEFDYEIINDGEIVDLIEKVKQILITEKII